MKKAKQYTRTFIPMKKVRLFLLVVACIPFLNGCKPDDPASMAWTRYEYLDEARDYIYFKTGTWWVYKNVQDGRLDTLEVFSSSIDTLKLTGNGNTMYFEKIEWKDQSRMDSYNYQFHRNFPPPLVEGLETNETVWMWYFISKFKPGNYKGETNIFTYPFTKEVVNNGSPHETKMLDDIDTITIQGDFYTDVKHFDISDDQGFIWDDFNRSGGHVQYYFAPKVGIIKKEQMTKNTSWELIESHILQ